MKLSLVVGCLLAVFGVSIANARHSEPDAIAVRTSAAARLVAVEDVECQQCESTWLGEPEGGVIYLRIHHRFTGSCGGGSEVVHPSRSDVPTNVVLVTSSAATTVDDGESYCARCGGTSLCHAEWDAGSCHLQCGVGGGEVSWRSEQELRTLLRTSQFEAARDLIDGNDRLALDASRHRVIILGCGDEVFSVVRLDRSATEALVSEL